MTAKCAWCVHGSQLRSSDIHKLGSISGGKPFSPLTSWSSKEGGRGTSFTGTITDHHTTSKDKYCDRLCHLRCDFIIKAYRLCWISSTPFTNEPSYSQEIFNQILRISIGEFGLWWFLGIFPFLTHVRLKIIFQSFLPLPSSTWVTLYKLWLGKIFFIFFFLFRDFSISARESWCPLSAVVFKRFLNSLILLANQVKTYSLLQGQLLFSSFLVTVSDQISWEGHECYLNGNASHQFCTYISNVGSSTHTYILESIPIPRQKIERH